MVLVQLVYVSRPSRALASSDLMAILGTARERNANDGVTGMLCYSGDFFLQILEGERARVCATFQKILRDERHRDVYLLSYTYPERRLFSEWDMGYVGLGDIPRALVLRYSEDGNLRPILADPHIAMAFLADIAVHVSETQTAPL
jgi:hypothetical protein